MSTFAIFFFGVGVSLMVGAALALVVWGAVQDGNTQQAEDENRPHPLDETVGMARLGTAGTPGHVAHQPVPARAAPVRAKAR